VVMILTTVVVCQAAETTNITIYLNQESHIEVTPNQNFRKIL
jgi:hypothetical protein